MYIHFHQGSALSLITNSSDWVHECVLSLGGFKLGLFRWCSTLIQSWVALNLRISSCHPMSFTGQSLLIVTLSASFIARTAGAWAAVLAWRHLSLCSWSLIFEGKDGPSGAVFLRRQRRTTSIKPSQVTENTPFVSEDLLLGLSQGRALKSAFH